MIIEGPFGMKWTLAEFINRFGILKGLEILIKLSLKYPVWWVLKKLGW